MTEGSIARTHYVNSKDLPYKDLDLKHFVEFKKDNALNLMKERNGDGKGFNINHLKEELKIEKEKREEKTNARKDRY